MSCRRRRAQDFFGAPLRLLGVPLSVAFLLGRFAGVARAWYAFPLAELAAATAAALHVRRESRTRGRPLLSDQM